MNGIQDYQKLESVQNVNQHTGINPLLKSKGHKPRTGKVVKCNVCGKDTYRKPCELRGDTKHFHCSRKCANEGLRRQGVVLRCDACGKDYIVCPSTAKWNNIREHKKHYCSKTCHARGQIGLTAGEKNGNWKGGKSRGYKTGYYSTEYALWRKLVFERDDFTCQTCKARSVYLHAHHIKGFTHYPELRFCVINGITLCKKCHREVHSNKCLNNAQQRILQEEAHRLRTNASTTKQKKLKTKNCLSSGGMSVKKEPVISVNTQSVL